MVTLFGIPINPEPFTYTVLGVVGSALLPRGLSTLGLTLRQRGARDEQGRYRP
jgi:hypothetical protein